MPGGTVRTSRKDDPSGKRRPPMKKGAPSRAWNFDVPGRTSAPDPFDFWDFDIGRGKNQPAGYNPNGETTGDWWSYQYEAPFYNQGKPSQEEQGAAGQQLTFADYLQLANALGLGGAQADYGALRDQLRANASSGDAKLAAMFSQLRKSIDADAPGIQQNYDQNASRLGQNAAQAQQQVGAGYDAARDAQTQQFAQLGIGDAAAVLAAAGGNAARDQAAAASNIQQNLAANQGQNAQNKTAAVNYNTGVGNAAGLEGAVQRAALQQELANKLAELETRESQDNGDRNQSLFSAAFQMAQNPEVFDPNYEQQVDPRADLELQLLAAQVQAQNYKNAGLAANTQVSTPNLSQLLALAQQNGLKIENSQDLEDFVNALKMSRQFG